MTRGHPPYVAIGEAERSSVAWGYRLMTVNADGPLPFDFIINDRGCISLVRVRRLKYPQYRIPDIGILCKTAIGELRQMPVPGGIYRQLWVRGTDRHWHRYLVLPDSIEMLEDEDDGDDPAGGGVLPPCSPLVRRTDRYRNHQSAVPK
jgi:hypothetical protein